MLANSMVAAISGLLLLLVWYHERAFHSALWWGLADCCIATAIALWVLQSSGSSLAVITSLAFDFAALLVWVAAHCFEGLSPPWYKLLYGFGIWILVLSTVFTVDRLLSAAFGAVFMAGVLLAAALTFWQGRSEGLRGRNMMIGLLCLHSAAVFLIATRLLATAAMPPGPPSSWYGTIHFEGLLYFIGTAVCLVTMFKEKSEKQHRAASLTDPLTGMGNRRAFMEQAGRLIERSAKDGVPVSVIVFDLDEFKSINDRFGHATGDHVLQVFADAISRALRPGDASGRLGGEEFGALLPGCDNDAAFLVASRVRGLFQENALIVNGRTVAATVSAGVASMDGEKCHIEHLLAAADEALYSAKSCGRNRVITADCKACLFDGVIVRIA